MIFYKSGFSWETKPTGCVFMYTLDKYSFEHYVLKHFYPSNSAKKRVTNLDLLDKEELIESFKTNICREIVIRGAS